MTKLLLAALFFSACAYETHFDDCTVRCTAASGCPDGFSCGAESWCRVHGASQTCEAILGDAGDDSGDDAAPQFTSCMGLPKTCGPAGNEDCCASGQTIPGGTFYRSYDVASDGMWTDMSNPAMVSSFKLDRFEVTVGRFRKFVEAGMGTQANPPMDGAGAHAKIAGSGWHTGWNSDLEPDQISLSTNLVCGDPRYATWTASAAANESLPLNCVTWFEAQAFCTWDGGYLPTEAEWNYVAAGGSEQRAFPWSSPAGALTTDCSYANYNLSGSTYCVPGTGGAVALMNRVGSESPNGDGRWGQADLGGNAWEWTLDWYASSYTNPCNDCMGQTVSNERVIRGGNFSHAGSYMRTSDRGLPSTQNTIPSSRTRDVGFRCARHTP